MIPAKKRRFMVRILSVFFFSILMSPDYLIGQTISDNTAQPLSIVETNKKMIVKLFQEAINERNPSIIDDLYFPEIGGLAERPVRKEEVIKEVRGLLDIFPDLKVSVEDIIAEGDKVVTREIWKGTHVSTRKEVSGLVIHIFRIKEGKVTDEWTKGWEWVEI